MFRENRDLLDRLGEARRTAAIGAVAQGLTHNLNNLLGVVVGYLDLIKCSYDQPSMINEALTILMNLSAVLSPWSAN